jgi:hypothetical protein
VTSARAISLPYNKLDRGEKSRLPAQKMLLSEKSSMLRHIVSNRIRQSWLPFLVICLLGYLIYAGTGQILFSVLIIGAGLGGAIGSIIVEARAATATTAGSRASPHTRPSLLQRFLLHRRLTIRFTSLMLLVAVLFTAAWSTGYYLLPEGMLRGQTAVPALIVEGRAETLWQEWLTIAAWNLTLPVAIILLANLLLRIHRYPAGYIILSIQTLLNGLVLGTNSFAIPLAEPMAPSLAVLQRAGPYEIAAYTLICVATYSLSHFEITSIFQGELRRVHTRLHFALTKEQWIALILGMVLLVFSAWREASMIMALG